MLALHVIIFVRADLTSAPLARWISLRVYFHFSSSDLSLEILVLQHNIFLRLLLHIIVFCLLSKASGVHDKIRYFNIKKE